MRITRGALLSPYALSGPAVIIKIVSHLSVIMVFMAN